ncbi:hypothetical protein COCNU_05G005540 [Cocos nucifera]|uniref:Uncharacterized protein n=1 Tax=Cocos nucifera TaxID=13894 RepID=A0A8K0N1I0_COCNU|nr:hypothetical protein COCNU_05G005540 [Cocos nucifera]
MNDLSLIMLALSCVAAITKLGSAKVSCSQFFSMVPDVTGRLMDMLLDFLPIKEAYYSIKDIGLHREFLFHFGPRAAVGKFKNDQAVEEIAFWVDLLQKQLQRAIDRERIWSRLTTCESIEVVCEELEWLPFYQRSLSNPTLDDKDKRDGSPREEAITRSLNVCSYWMTSFIKYSKWLENPSNIKAARFLSRGHAMLNKCIKELDVVKDKKEKEFVEHQGSCGSERNSPVEPELDSFDKALESVEEALNRLEDLLQELHLSNANPGTEHLKAACSDLERIRKLKKEAEFLEASFRAKAASLEQVAIAVVDNQDLELNEIHRFELLRNELIELEKRVQRSTNDSQNEKEADLIDDKDKHAPAAVNTLFVKAPKKDSVIAKSMEKIKETTTVELIFKYRAVPAGMGHTIPSIVLIPVFIVPSHIGWYRAYLTILDVWQGTQLLAIDVAAAMVLLKRALTGDELTEKEKKALQRTLTDLASVVPIGFLMLLPIMILITSAWRSWDITIRSNHFESLFTSPSLIILSIDHPFLMALMLGIKFLAKLSHLPSLSSLIQILENFRDSYPIANAILMGKSSGKNDKTILKMLGSRDTIKSEVDHEECQILKPMSYGRIANLKAHMDHRNGLKETEMFFDSYPIANAILMGKSSGKNDKTILKMLGSRDTIKSEVDHEECQILKPMSYGRIANLKAHMDHRNGLKETEMSKELEKIHCKNLQEHGSLLCV